MEENRDSRAPQPSVGSNNLMFQYIPSQSVFPSSGHMPMASFNPATPVFQPGHMELQRFEVGTQATYSPELYEMRRCMATMNSHSLSNMDRMEERIQQTHKEMNDMKEMFKRDLQTLQARITARGTEGSTTIDEAGKASTIEDDTKSRSPAEKMLDEFSEEEVARAYQEEAEEKEALAATLRERAKLLLGHLPVPNKLPSESGMSVANDKTVEYSCCKTAYSSFDQLFEHVQEWHAGSLKLPSNIERPLFTPQPHSERSRSQTRSPAFKIKAPWEVSGTENQSQWGIDRGETKAISVTKWTPYTVRQMAPFTGDIPATHTQTFSFDLLMNALEGELWQDGFYFDPQDSILPSSSYWVLDPDAEPYLPSKPGAHGAKLTPFFHDNPIEPGTYPGPDNYNKVPVFIRAADSNEYVYYGNYSQTRFSDKVDYDRLMEDIPVSVRHHWAQELAAVGRPKWVTRKLIGHFWPQPTYDGPIPMDSTADASTPTTAAAESKTSDRAKARVRKALEAYNEELQEWAKDADIKVGLLTEKNIFDAFAAVDCDTPPGLRLFWEYFECVEYDVGFYDFLMKVKENPALAVPGGRLGRSQAMKPATASIRIPQATSIDNSVVVKTSKKRTKAKNLSPGFTGEITNPDFLPQPEVVCPWKPTPAEIAADKALCANGTADSKKPTIFTPNPFADENNNEAPKPASKSIPPHKRNLHLQRSKPWMVNASERTQTQATPVSGRGQPIKQEASGAADWSVQEWGQTEGAKRPAKMQPEPMGVDGGDKSGKNGWNGLGDIEAAKEFQEDLKAGYSNKSKAGKRAERTMIASLAPHLKHQQQK